jgi:TRAP-type uncharacterized transport system substrate-binding protein
MAYHPHHNAEVRFSPEKKQKLRLDCMIAEITHDEIDRALKKRPRIGDTNVPTQTYGSSNWGTPLTPGAWTES